MPVLFFWSGRAIFASGCLVWIRKKGEVTNRFFAKVAERSDGLPIYLNCLLHDLHQGRSVRKADSLPRGIHAYHEELLQRHDLGDFQAVATASLVILAMAHEPLTNVELTIFKASESNRHREPRID